MTGAVAAEEAAGDDSQTAPVDVANLVLHWALSTLGLILNMWIVIGLRRNRKRRGLYFLIWALSLIDFYFVCFLFGRYALVGTLRFISANESWNAQMIAFLRPQYVAVQLMTIWFVMALNRERFVTVCKPFQSPSQNTFTKADAKRLYLMLVFLCVAVCVPLYFDWFVISDETRSTSGYTISLKYVYKLGLYSLFAHVTPLLAILYLQCRIHSSKRNEEREQQFLEEPIQTCGPNYVAGTTVDHLRVSVQLVRSDIALSPPAEDVEKEKSLTRSITAITIIFVACQIPWVTYRLFEEGLMEGRTPDVTGHLEGAHISALLLNSAIKCVVYCALCRALRRSVCYCSPAEDEEEEEEEEVDEPAVGVRMRSLPRTVPYGTKLETTF